MMSQITLIVFGEFVLANCVISKKAEDGSPFKCSGSASGPARSIWLILRSTLNVNMAN